MRRGVHAVKFDPEFTAGKKLTAKQRNQVEKELDAAAQSSETALVTHDDNTTGKQILCALEGCDRPVSTGKNECGQPFRYCGRRHFYVDQAISKDPSKASARAASLALTAAIAATTVNITDAKDTTFSEHHHEYHHEQYIDFYHIQLHDGYVCLIIAIAVMLILATASVLGLFSYKKGSVCEHAEDRARAPTIKTPPPASPSSSSESFESCESDADEEPPRAAPPPVPDGSRDAPSFDEAPAPDLVRRRLGPGRVTPLVSERRIEACLANGHHVRDGRNQYAAYLTCHQCMIHCTFRKYDPPPQEGRVKKLIGAMWRALQEHNR
jgi:hypothetical protein